MTTSRHGHLAHCSCQDSAANAVAALVAEGWDQTAASLVVYTSPPPGTFATTEEWENQPQTCCAHCGRFLGQPLPMFCAHCRRDPKPGGKA